MGAVFGSSKVEEQEVGQKRPRAEIPSPIVVEKKQDHKYPWQGLTPKKGDEEDGETKIAANKSSPAKKARVESPPPLPPLSMEGKMTKLATYVRKAKWSGIIYYYDRHERTGVVDYEIMKFNGSISKSAKGSKQGLFRCKPKGYDDSYGLYFDLNDDETRPGQKNPRYNKVHGVDFVFATDKDALKWKQEKLALSTPAKASC